MTDQKPSKSSKLADAGKATEIAEDDLEKIHGGALLFDEADSIFGKRANSDKMKIKGSPNNIRERTHGVKSGR